MSTIPHLPDCICDQRLDVFVCDVCERETPYCRGSDGDDLCDECWIETRIVAQDAPQAGRSGDSCPDEPGQGASESARHGHVRNPDVPRVSQEVP